MVYYPYSQQYKNGYHAGYFQYSLEEYPADILAHEPNMKRAQLRPDGWGSIQTQKTTKEEKTESNLTLFYVALAILALVIMVKIIRSPL